MIQITERWSVYRDEYQWVLVEHYEGKDKHGEPKAKTRQTYYPWLDIALRYAADKDCEGADSLREVEKAYSRMVSPLRGRDSAYEREIKDLLAEIRRLEKRLKQAENVRSAA